MILSLAEAFSACEGFPCFWDMWGDSRLFLLFCNYRMSLKFFSALFCLCKVPSGLHTIANESQCSGKLIMQVLIIIVIIMKQILIGKLVMILICLKNYGDCFVIKDKKDRRLYQNGLRIKHSPKADSVPRVKLATSNYITC